METGITNYLTQEWLLTPEEATNIVRFTVSGKGLEFTYWNGSENVTQERGLIYLSEVAA